MISHSLVAMLATLRAQINVFDQRIAELVADHPDGALFRSLPGAGDALTPRLIVAFGTQRDRYQSAYEMQCYSGIAPVTEASGKSQWVHFRFICPKFLRQTFHEFAGCSQAQLVKHSRMDVVNMVRLLDPAIGVGSCLLRPSAQG